MHLKYASECKAYNCCRGWSAYHTRGEIGEPRRWGRGEPSSGLRFCSRCLYLGLWRIQRCRASHASCCRPALVKLTARAIKAVRLLGWSSRHLGMRGHRNQQEEEERDTHTHTDDEEEQADSQSWRESGMVKQVGNKMTDNG